MAAVGLAVGVALWSATAATESCWARFSNPIADVCQAMPASVPDRAGLQRERVDQAGRTRAGADMKRMPFLAVAGLAAGIALWSAYRRGADLHGAIRQSDYGRVLGVPVPDLDRAGLHRRRLGRAGHRTIRPRRSAFAARRSPASGCRSACGSRPGWWTSPAPPGASPIWAGSTSIRACPRRAGAPGSSMRRRRGGLRVARALLRLSAVVVDRRAA